MENPWILAFVVFLTQVIFIWSRTWNINAIAEKNMKAVLISGAVIHWAWLLSIAIGAYSMREILLDFQWHDVPVVLGSTFGGLYGSWLGMKQKIAKDLKAKLFRQAGQAAAGTITSSPITEDDILVKKDEFYSKTAFNYDKNKFFWPANYEKFNDRIKSMYLSPGKWLNIQVPASVNLPFPVEGINFKEMILMVDQFHKQFQLPMKNQGHLNYEMMIEELQEYRDAVIANDDVEKLDAVTDMLYLILGIIRKEGFENLIEIAFSEVHYSNLSKGDLKGEPIFKENGKLGKGPNYKKPRLKEIVALKK
jgi:hypothetical protein